MTNKSQVGTLNQLFEKCLRKYADRTAVHREGRSLTYAELDRRSSAVANELVDRGVSVGEPVTLMLSNSLSYVVIDLALFKTGAARFALNDMLSADECEYMCTDTRVETVFINENFVETFEDIRPAVDSLERVYTLDDGSMSRLDATSYETLLDSSDESVALNVAVTPDDKALHAYTGGTTGKPKGLVHTNKGIWSRTCIRRS